MSASASHDRASADSLAQWASIRAQLESAGADDPRQFALLRQAAQTCPDALLRHDAPLSAGSEDERLQLALAALDHPAVRRESVDVSNLARVFGLRSPPALARLLAPLADRHGMDTAECIVALGMSTRTDLELGGPAWHFSLAGKPAALAVAKALLALHRPDPENAMLKDRYNVTRVAAAALDSSQLSSDDRIELLRTICSRSDSGLIANAIDAHVQAPAVRRELALAVARNSWTWETATLGALAQSPKEVIFEQAAFRLRDWPAQANRQSVKQLCEGFKFGMAIGELAVPDQMDLYAHAIRAAGRLDERQAVPWSRLHHAIFNACRGFDATYVAGFGEAFAAQVGESLGLRPPFTDMMANVEGIDDEDRRDALYEEILSAAFMMGHQNPETMERFAPVLTSLHGARPAELRAELAGALIDAVHVAGSGKVIDFIHSGQFHRRHMHAFAAVLARLYAPDARALPAPLHTMLRDSKLKDGRRWQSVTRDLLAVVGSGGLSRQARRRLIELSAPEGPAASGAVDDFVKRVKMLAMAARAIDLERVDAVQARGALDNVASTAELDAALGGIARRAMPGSAANRESSDPGVHANWHRFMSESRRPEALLGYAQAVNARRSLDLDDDEDAELNDDDHAELVATIDSYADAVVWSANRNQAFAALRYDTTASTHLAHIAEHAPHAWNAWRSTAQAVPIAEREHRLAATFDIRSYLYQRLIQDRHLPVSAYPTLTRVLQRTLEVGDALRFVHVDSGEHRLLQLLDSTADPRQHARTVQALIARLPTDPAFGQFRRDLDDLKTLLSARPAALSRMRAVDTDDPEDLLLCGTEVVGSCQSVSGQLSLNKALMGYVVDGKYRMLAVKDEQGRVAARRMLRLLCDEQGAPALHLERLYANPGIADGDAADDALIALAKSKAGAMGCPLFSDADSDDDGDDDNTWTLHSLDSRAPFEYVDANGGVMEREYEIQANRIAR